MGDSSNMKISNGGAGDRSTGIRIIMGRESSKRSYSE